MASDAAYLTTTDGRRPRVAVVDGNHATATITTLLVEQFGCAPVAAPSGEAALALIRSGEAVDLVLIDLDIPDMDGIVAATLIRALGERGSMPIVPFAHARGDVTGPRGRAAGFTGAILKPYSPRELHAAIQTALSRSPAVAPTGA